ncbi:MAG: hypothetical protein KY433_07675 [Actinobacteria bacterium]|nr:hypothetical protein [Actinomycetota bacterium]
MLSAEAAKAALAARREQSAAKAARGRVTSALGKAAGALADSRSGTAIAVKRLEALGRRGRRAAFGAACPGMGGELAAVFENAGQLTYQGDWDRRPFRAPQVPSLARERVLQAARLTAPELVAHAAEPVWLARWAGHLLSQSWQTSAHLVGWMLAAAVDAGSDEVLELLVASTDGSDEIATMGRHVPIALLCADRPDGWERVEALLLSAQRQEGLRQSILEVADEAQPEALRRMLALILDNGLSRFASVARAVSVWLGLEVFAGDRRRIDTIAERALGFLSDPQAGSAATRSGEALDVYVALWAAATRDVHAAVELALAVLRSRDAECRFSAVAFLAQTRLDAAVEPLLRALGDEDLRVAATAVHPLLAMRSDVIPESYDVIERLLARVAKRSVQLDPVQWLGPLPPLKREDVGRLLVRHRLAPDLDRVLAHRGALETWDRRYVVERLATGRLTAERRAALLESLGDPSAQVREAAIGAAARVKLTDDEALALEALLRRKPGDLRRGVIELVLGRGDRWALAAADRLLASKDPQERLGAVELLRRVAAGGSGAAGEATARLAGLDEGERDRAVEEATRRAIGDSALTGFTEADGFGLFDPADLTPIVPPRATGFKIASTASRRLLRLLDELIEEHADVEVEIDRFWGGAERQLLGAVEHAGLREHHQRLRRGETDIEIPLLGLWQRFAAELPTDARDDDGLHLLRAVLSCAEAENRYRWDEQAKAAADLGIRRVGLVHDVLGLLLEIDPDEHLLAGALDAAEAALAALSKRALSRRTDYSWQLPALQIARTLVSRCAAAPADLLRRHWRLERWLAEPPGVKLEQASHWHATPRRRHSDRLPDRPPVEVVVRAFERGAATEADLVDHLVGPRGPHWSFWDLAHVSSRRRAERVGGGGATLEVVARIRERIIAMELARGEAPTPAAEAVRALSHSGGLEVLTGALVALGREKFVRGWSTDGEGRASVFSHMIATSYPAEADSPELFAAAMREARIADRRLREVACYAPQWAGHVEATLAVPGLADGVWWLHAHTKDDRWNVDAELKAEWERSVADRTELSPAQLVDGAVDVRWFAEIRERAGDAALDELLAAAKYGSTAGGHKRAELFARAMRGQLGDSDLLQRIAAKRHQDSVRALGLLPLPAAPQPRQEALARRYEALHEFRRQSRQFGKQRQASEGRAADIGLENLARSAGFSDPVRLTWAMEAAATADLAGGGAVAHRHVAVAVVRDLLVVDRRVPWLRRGGVDGKRVRGGAAVLPDPVAVARLHLVEERAAEPVHRGGGDALTGGVAQDERRARVGTRHVHLLHAAPDGEVRSSLGGRPVDAGEQGTYQRRHNEDAQRNGRSSQGKSPR